MQLNYILLNLCRPYHQTQQLVSRKFVRITTCDENVLMLQHNGKPCFNTTRYNVPQVTTCPCVSSPQLSPAKQYKHLPEMYLPDDDKLLTTAVCSCRYLVHPPPGHNILVYHPLWALVCALVLSELSHTIFPQLNRGDSS